MSVDTELLEVSFEALAKHKKAIDATKDTLVSLDTKVSEVSDTLFEETSRLNSNISKITNDIPDLVKGHIDKIPIPKDGKDGKSIVGPEGKPGKDGKSIVGPKGKNGKDGKDGKSIVGPAGRDGKDGKSIKGKDGKHGKDGADGVGIENITATQSSMNIELTNGKTKVVRLPRQRTHSSRAPSKRIAGTTDTGTLYNLTDVYANGAANGEVLTYEDGYFVTKPVKGTSSDNTSFNRRTEIENMFKQSESTAYKKLTYTDGNITNVDIYVDDSQDIKLFSKVIGYNNGNITSISITDEVNSGTLDKTITYTDGNVSSVATEYIA